MERGDWNKRYDTADLLWKAAPNRLLVAEVDGLQPGRALDAGCGEGRNAVWLAEQGWQVTGVDFSDVAIDKARRVGQERGAAVDWVVADLRDYEPDRAGYDLVVVLYLHLPAADRRTVLRRCAAALGEGSSLVVIGHDSTNIADGYGGPQDSDLLFSPEDVVADVADVDGVTVVRAERVAREVPTDAGPRTAIDALVRLARTPGRVNPG